MLEGIRVVKSKPLRITNNSTNILKEIRAYKWKEDKEGKIKLPEQPVKFNDHACDAIRYGVFTKMRRPVFQLLVA